jgi:hypothetical protein
MPPTRCSPLLPGDVDFIIAMPRAVYFVIDFSHFAAFFCLFCEAQLR